MKMWQTNMGACFALTVQGEIIKVKGNNEGVFCLFVFKQGETLTSTMQIATTLFTLLWGLLSGEALQEFGTEPSLAPGEEGSGLGSDLRMPHGSQIGLPSAVPPLGDFLPSVLELWQGDRVPGAQSSPRGKEALAAGGRR